MIKVLKAGVTGYKGGELSYLECFNSIREAIEHSDELLYNIIKLHDESIDWNNLPILSLNDFRKSFEKYLTLQYDNEYPSDDMNTVYKLFKLDINTNVITNINIKEIMETIDIESFKEELEKYD